MVLSLLFILTPVRNTENCSNAPNTAPLQNLCLGNRKGIRPVKNWMLICRWQWFECSFVLRVLASLLYCHVHYLLLLKHQGWLDLLVPVYPGRTGILAFKISDVVTRYNAIFPYISINVGHGIPSVIDCINQTCVLTDFLGHWRRSSLNNTQHIKCIRCTSFTIISLSVLTAIFQVNLG